LACLGSMAQLDVSDLLRVNKAKSTSGNFIQVEHIALTSRAKQCLVTTFDKFFYLQLIVDDYMLPIPATVLDKFTFTDKTPDYGYIALNPREYGEQVKVMVRHKAFLVLLFLEILEVAWTCEEVCYSHAFDQLTNRWHVELPSVAAIRNAIIAELGHLNVYHPGLLDIGAIRTEAQFAEKERGGGPARGVLEGRGGGPRCSVGEKVGQGMTRVSLLARSLVGVFFSGVLLAAVGETSVILTTKLKVAEDEALDVRVTLPARDQEHERYALFWDSPLHAAMSGRLRQSTQELLIHRPFRGRGTMNPTVVIWDGQGNVSHRESVSVEIVPPWWRNLLGTAAGLFLAAVGTLCVFWLQRMLSDVFERDSRERRYLLTFSACVDEMIALLKSGKSVEMPDTVLSAAKSEWSEVMVEMPHQVLIARTREAVRLSNAGVGGEEATIAELKLIRGICAETLAARKRNSLLRPILARFSRKASSS